MSEHVTVKTFCPASQIMATITLQLQGKQRGAVVSGKPIACNLQSKCLKADSIKCLLSEYTEKLTTKR